MYPNIPTQKNEHNLIQSNDILHKQKKKVQKKHFEVSHNWNQVKNLYPKNTHKKQKFTHN